MGKPTAPTRATNLPKPGDPCTRDPNRYLKPKETTISRAYFSGLCREILNAICPGYRAQPGAFLALQVASERHVVTVMADAALCANHANRITVTETDLKLALRLRGI